MSDLGEPRKLRPLPGGNPDALVIVGRDQTVANIFEVAASGADQLLADPRRMGKTVTMKYLRTKTPDRWAVSFCDFQGVDSVAGFVARAFEQIRDHASLTERTVAAIKGFFADATFTLGSSEVLQLSKTFENDATNGFERAMLTLDARLVDDNQHLLLCWDEIPDMIESVRTEQGPGPAAALLQTFRRVRQQTKAIRWLVAGSVGFHHIRKDIGANVDVVNDMHGVPFGPIDEPSARWLAHGLLLYITDTPTEAAIDALVDRSGRIPFLAHAIANQLHIDGPEPVTATAVHDAFRQYVNNYSSSFAATHFLARIEQYYGDDAVLANQILDHLAPTDALTFDQLRTQLADNITNRDQLLRVLDLLKLDHYLHKTLTGDIEWRYSILGEIWHLRRPG